jgi:uncharacterized protein YggE
VEVEKTVSFHSSRHFRRSSPQEKLMLRSKMFLLAGLVLASQVQAQPVAAPATTGTLVVVPATAEVKHANDEAVLLLSVEEFDKDKSAAANRVNQKMKQGVEIVKREDPHAQLKTQGYYSYPVYPENPPHPLQESAAPVKPIPTGWRVGQYLEVRTTNLSGLAKTTAAAQKVLALSNLQFGLTEATTKQLDDARIAATYRNLNERIAAIASAMGRKVSDAVIDTVDFEGSGNYAGGPGAPAPMYNRADMAMRKGASEVAEPSFEPGETILQMRLVGKVKFK